MSLVLNTNVSSLQGQNALSNTQKNQAATFQRLSTGLRINSAKDDAGGLYLAQAQTKDIRGLGMATRNAGDGISMSQTAEGALDQIGKNLHRINELAVQSANGSYNAAARDGLQKEVNELTQEINRIVETTEFNGNKLLNSDAVSSALQISFKNDANSQISVGLEGGLEKAEGMSRISFFGTDKIFANATEASAVHAVGMAMKQELYKVLGLDVGTTSSSKLLASSDITQSLAKGLIDLAKDGGSAQGVLSGATAKVDGHTFVVHADGLAVTATLADGTKLEISGNFAEKISGVVSAAATGTIASGAAALANLTICGADVNIATFNANALKDVLAGGLGTEKTVDISTQQSAQAAIQQSRNAIDMVSELRATFGAAQNRFEAVIEGNQTYSENLSASRSRVQDADFAVETANLAKQQVLQQAGVSILGQANASSQAILGLL